MRVVNPVVITSSNLLATNIPENDAPEWMAGSYLSAARVIRTTTHRIYEALSDLASTVPPELDPLNWSDVGPTNRYAMFDSEISTQTEATGQISSTILQGVSDTLALLNIAGDTLTVEITEGAGGPVQYSYSQSLSGTPVADWFEYFFSEPQQQTEVIVYDLPLVPDGRIIVTLDSGGRSAIGQFLVGTIQEIGGVQRGANVGIIDYSRKDTDEFGVTRFVKRRFTSKMQVSLYMDNSRLNAVYKLLTSLRSTPTLWIGTDEPQFEPLVIYGFYRDFSIDITYSTISYCNLEIEGLT